MVGDWRAVSGCMEAEPVNLAPGDRMTMGGCMQAGLVTVVHEEAQRIARASQKEYWYGEKSQQCPEP